MELIKKNEYDLTENKAKEIASIYVPMVQMLEQFEERYNKIVNEPITNNLVKKAKRLRIEIKKIRTTADNARKEAKAEYLRAGNAIQGAYNTLKYAVVSKEEKLKEIENYYENLEKERLDNLERERLELVLPFVEFPPSNLAHMEQDVFDNYLTGLKAKHQAKIEAEKKAEAERIEKEKKLILQNQRLNVLRPFWNFLTADEQAINLGDLTENDFSIILKKSKKSKLDYDNKQIEIEKENEKLKKEKAKEEQKRLLEIQKEKEKQAKIKKLADEKLKKEKEEKEKLERELKKQKAKEEQRLAEIEKAKQLELAKGDEAKFKDFISDLENLKTKYIFESEEKISKYKKAGDLIDKIINFIK
jgi:hypothetical protein